MTGHSCHQPTRCPDSTQEMAANMKTELWFCIEQGKGGVSRRCLGKWPMPDQSCHRKEARRA